MKNLKLVVMFFFFLLICSQKSYSQKNSSYFGDKSNTELIKSINVMDVQLKLSEKKVEKILKENKNLAKRFERSNNVTNRDVIAKTIILNDSLVLEYKKNITYMEEQKMLFVQRATGTEQQKYFQSKGNNPRRLLAAAKAYETVTYANAYTSGLNSPGSQLYNLTGTVLNKWYRDVLVTVYGPANFRKEFFLSKNGGQETFNLTTPGMYQAVFNYGHERRVVNKKVLPDPNRFSVINGENYNFSAILLRR